MKRKSFGCQGFSLIELLVVVAVICILMALVTPAMNSIRQGTAVTSGGQQVADTLLLARQLAVSRNQRMDVRLVKMPSPVGNVYAYRGIQIWLAKDGGTTMVPYSRLIGLPTGVVVMPDATHSPMLQTPAPASTVKTPVAGVNQDSVVVTFLADGSLASSFSATNSYFTLAGERDAASASPANFSAIRINPVTGEVAVFRP